MEKLVQGLSLNSSSPDVTLKVCADESGYVLVSVQPNLGKERTPCDVCCVVDVSGSMSTAATTGPEADGLSILDVVKHALNTIISNLEPVDRLSIVSFTTDAKVVLELTPMNAAGRKQALAAVEKMHPEANTNLWAGLQTGLEVLRNRKSEQSKKSAILLLTDGEPNVIPPGGHLPALQSYKDKNKQLVCSVNTFGFGYKLDSVLLNELAIEGNGSYAFIPDSSFVGTIFVNSLSNLLTTISSNTILSIEPLNGAKIEDKGILGGFPLQNASWGAAVQFGSIRYGLTKDLVVKMTLPENKELPFLRATLKLQDGKEVSAEGVSRDSSNNKPVLIQRYRLQYVDVVRGALSMCESNNAGAIKLVKELIGTIKDSPVAKEAFIVDLLKDLEGQTTEALSRKDYFTKWGKHFLPSLMGAHLQQTCNNFKDPGVQHYSSKIFTEVRDKLEDAFLKIPPPKPSKPQAAAAPVKIQNYYNASGGCFAGECHVLLADGQSTKPVKLVQQGDVIMTSQNATARVLCVVKTSSPTRAAQNLVEISGGLLITAWHPIRFCASSHNSNNKNEWVFPHSVGKAVLQATEAVYTFVLDSGHVAIINGVECVTLGHGFEENDVVKHPYFGTQRVVDDLKATSGWARGLVHVRNFERDPTTGLVQRVVEEEETGVRSVSPVLETASALVL
jgi:hypothetical protein